MYDKLFGLNKVYLTLDYKKDNIFDELKDFIAQRYHLEVYFGEGFNKRGAYFTICYKIPSDKNLSIDASLITCWNELDNQETFLEYDGYSEDNTARIQIKIFRYE